MAAKKTTTKKSKATTETAMAETKAATKSSSKRTARTAGKTAGKTASKTEKAAGKAAKTAAKGTTKAVKAVSKAADKTAAKADKAAAKAAAKADKAASKTASKAAKATQKGAVAKSKSKANANAKPKSAKSAGKAAASVKAAGTKKAGKATKRKVSPVPRGYKTVTPSVSLADASATIAFCKKAFGAKVRSKTAAPGGKIMQAEIEIGDSIVMLADAVQEPACISSLFLYVVDVDKAMAKAVKAGATVTMPAQNMFWGDRIGRLVDPQGNIWSIGSRVELVRPEEFKKRAKAAARQFAVAS